MIPSINAEALSSGDPAAREAIREGAFDVGFLTLRNTPLVQSDVEAVLDAYRGFFMQPTHVKDAVNMAKTGSNRGWGASGSEQVDPKANPDYKEVFDCGVELPSDDPMAHLSVYAPNAWPAAPVGFRKVVEAYFDAARQVSLDLLCALAEAVGEDRDFFADKFAKPMALLRGNYYPARPNWAGDKDFGIAAHTDYGCLTLLATDGQPGLEVQLRGGAWQAVSAEPGTFIVNFGEMFEMWTAGRVKATLHRVIGGPDERLSVPLFFNPSFTTNVAPMGSDKVIQAGDYLTQRYQETYVHLQAG